MKTSKPICITILFLFFSVNLFCQTKGILHYKLKVVDEIDKIETHQNHIIYFHNNKSIQFTQNGNVKESTVYSGENNIQKTIVVSDNNRKSFVYKNFDKKELKLADFIGLKKYLIYDTLANFKWVITNEKQKILKYKCTKATASFRGREYIAWFTEDIAIQNGPWKFCGLPGLIIKIHDKDKFYEFELDAIDLKTNFDDSIVNVPDAYSNDQPIDHQTFINTFNMKVSNIDAINRSSIKMTKIGSGSIISRSFDKLPSKIEKF